MPSRKNDKLSQIVFRKNANCLATAVVLLGVTGLLVFLARRYPSAVESVYRPFSRFALNGLAWVAQVVPVSLAEILLYLVIAAGLVAVVYLLIRLIKGPRRLSALVGWLARVLAAGSVFVFAFYLLWGLNYHAPKLSETLSLPVQPRTAEELAALTKYLAEKANALSAQVQRDENGSVVLSDWDEVAKAVAEEFSKTTGRPEVAVKPVLFSKGLSMMQVTGVFSPYTGEANVNRDNVASDLPFTMAHEMAHRYAIAPENEANFFAFYTLHESDNPLLSYSAHLAALRSAHNALASANASLASEIAATYDERVIADIREYNRHWAQYEGKVAEVSTKVYNTYLITQGQESGIRSYGEMVDLLLAWFASEAR